MSMRDDALAYHRTGRPGKIEITATKPLLTQQDLALAYSPGVAAPVREIAADPEAVFDYTARGNLVAVLSNGRRSSGSATSGRWRLPVMEGKGVLFKRFADVDVFDIEVDTLDPEEIIQVARLIAPTFGGINLEDIRAPECFHIEEKLQSLVDIPVFHDDQHGTAIISGAALINALEIVGKAIGDVRIVVNGAGAAGIASAEFYVALGARRSNIVLCDSQGVIWDGREDGMNEYKARFAVPTEARTLADAMVDADVFVGVSVAGCVTPEMLRTMARDPIVFALANPDPEIRYDVAVATRPDCIMATGRSDLPNQVNNVLGFPFIFRGALDVRARAINGAMKVAAAQALARLARADVPDGVLKAYGLEHLHFGRDYLIPKPFDRRALEHVAPAVAAAAIESGVARRTLDLEAYPEQLASRQGLRFAGMRAVIRRAQTEPKRVVFAEGEEAAILRAACQLRDEGIARPILIGRPAVIAERLEELRITCDVPIVDPEHCPTDARERYADWLYQRRHRKGMTRSNALEMVTQPNALGAVMLAVGHADAFLSGLSFNYVDVLRPAIQIVGTRPDVSIISGVYLMIVRNAPYFFSDATVNVNPDADQLAEIAANAAAVAQTFGVTPRIAMLSFSNFGSARTPESDKVRRAVEILRARRPDLDVDGEMQADTAVDSALVDEHFPFSRIRDANVLIFPNLDAANASYKLLHRLGGAAAVGPILHGMARPVHVIPTGASVRDIVNIAALAVVDAQRLPPRPPPPPRPVGARSKLRRPPPHTPLPPHDPPS
ncbi:MAG: NADP-dependent malic enzyme [Anaerolineae bacterium]